MVKQTHEESRIPPGLKRRTPLTLTVPAHLPGGRAEDSAGSNRMFQQRFDQPSHPGKGGTCMPRKVLESFNVSYLQVLDADGHLDRDLEPNLSPKLSASCIAAWSWPAN